MKLRELNQPQEEFWDMNHLKVYKIFDKVHYKNEAQYRQLFHPFNLSKSGFRYTPNEKKGDSQKQSTVPPLQYTKDLATSTDFHISRRHWHAIVT